MSNPKLKPAFYTLLTTILLMSCATAAWAQADKKVMDEEGTVATVWKIWAKSGQETQFEAALKKHAAWRKSAGEKFVWRIYQPVVGNDLGHYIIRSGSHFWKDMDTNEAWAVQAKAGEAYDNEVGPFTERVEHYFSEVDTKHTNWIESPDYKYYSVTSFSTKPGTYTDRMAALDKIQKAVDDEKWPYPYSIAYTIGGSGGMSIVTPMKSYADMADPDPSLMKILAKSLGSESDAAETMKSFSATYKSSENTIYMYRPDLSTPK